MADFNVRSDSVDVEQIMEQIQARIRAKRGVDYTEQQIRELAAVKLEKFLDPRGVRSDLLQQFQRMRTASPTPVPLYTFEDTTLFESDRALVRFVRRLLKPFVKLMFSSNVLTHVLHAQAEINRQYLERLDELRLHYELLHNLVVEITRLGIETKNLKMRVESLQSRLEFNERRARALESVVAYKPAGESAPEPPPPADRPAGAAAATPGEGPGQRSRRRRRRRGRRGGPPASAIMGQGGSAADAAQAEAAEDEDAAAREAGESHAATAERIEQAFADEAQRSEARADDVPEPHGPDPHEQ
jgi:hypothetical protein